MKRDRESYPSDSTRKHSKHIVFHNTDVVVKHIGVHLSLVDRHSLSIAFNMRMYKGFSRLDDSMKLLRSSGVDREELYGCEQLEVVQYFWNKEPRLSVFIASAAKQGHLHVIAFLCKQVDDTNWNGLFEFTVIELMKHGHLDACKTVYLNTNKAFWNEQHVDAHMRTRCWKKAIVLKHVELALVMIQHATQNVIVEPRRLNVIFMYAAMTVCNTEACDYYWNKIEPGNGRRARTERALFLFRRMRSTHECTEEQVEMMERHVENLIKNE